MQRRYFIDDSTGFKDYGEEGSRSRSLGDRVSIDTTNVDEWSVMWEDTGTFVGSIDLDYRLNPDDDWTEYQANLVAGTRYTHADQDGVFQQVSSAPIGSFLPVYQLSINMDAYTSGSCDVHIIARSKSLR